ncbi:hypothetical protein VTI74DRAFT_9014 [Chaetomium olivicolor]
MSSPAFLSESARWNAVKRKDTAADGVFVYGVRTTKIYCRPVCKARLARRANVVFYDTADVAERANYRPCKRCKPDLAGRMPEGKAVQRVRALVERKLPLAGAGAAASGGAEGHPSPPVTGSLAEMARQAGLSKWHFHRVFKEVTNMTPTEYVRQQSWDLSSDYTSSLEGECSRPQSCGVVGETRMNPKLSGSAVPSTDGGLAAPLVLPTSKLAPEHVPIVPALDDLEFNFDDFLTTLENDFFERLSRIPDDPVSEVKFFPWEAGYTNEL